jgi:hypothetical protein
MEREPDASDDADNAADPPLTGAVPIVVAPSRNWTVPVATVGETVAVKVTDWVKIDGFGAAASDTADGALETVCVRAGDVLVV